MKKKIGTILLSVIIAAGISMASFGAVNGQVNGQWQQDASTGAWYYRNVDDGTALTDFQCINGKWYFLSTAEDGTKGMMLTGLQWIGHKLYYLNPDDGGAVAFNMDYGGYHFGQYGCSGHLQTELLRFSRRGDGDLLRKIWLYALCFPIDG